MQLEKSRPKVDVVMGGHRDHYGTPRVLESLGVLRNVVTDLYVGRGSSFRPIFKMLQTCGANLAGKLAARQCDLPAEKIMACNLAGVNHYLRRRRARSVSEHRAIQLALAKDLANQAERVCRPRPDVVVGYRMSDGLFSKFKGHSQCFLCQNDGGIHEVRVVREEAENFRDWLPPRHKESGSHVDWVEAEEERLFNEWRLADRIVCWSSWALECVNATENFRSKCLVLPPVYESHQLGDVAPFNPSFGRKRKIVFGFLGTLSVRKGLPRLLIALSELSRSFDVELLMAGSLAVDERILDRYSGFSTYLGVLTRQGVAGFLSKIDVLVLPSLSEGVPMVQLECMAAGRPLIVSDRCGDVVEHGVHGLVCEAGSTEALRAELLKVCQNPAILGDFSSNCSSRLADYSLNACANRWDACLADL